VTGMALLLSTPFVDVLVIGGGVRWFSAYGVVMAIGFSAAAVAGTMADEPPEGATRAEKEMDLSRRVQDANLANAFVLTGVVLTTVAAVALIWHWRH